MIDAPINAEDRIELRRFVGREFLLWLWFRSESEDSTLSTKAHGSFGLWVAGRLVLTVGRESTVIKGTTPGVNREAKEALLLGKTPERAGLQIALGDQEIGLTLRGETMAFAGLTPPKKAKATRGEVTQEEADDDFSSRMHHARDVEAIVEALYRDFLAVRLGGAWPATLRRIEAWVAGKG